MDNNSLKKSFMGGYNKKSVHTLLEEISDDHASQLSALAEEKGKLEDKIIALEAHIKELETKVGSASEEKDYVASAIVSAEKEAAKILAEAARKSEELKANTERDLADERSQIKDLRLSVLQAMQAYKDKLDGIISRMAIDEDK